MAEIIQVKNQKLKSCGFPTEISRFLNNHSPERLPAILTTIVARRGSAPRSVGTKMLVLQDGTITAPSAAAVWNPLLYAAPWK